MKVVTLGLSHKTAPVEIREKFAFTIKGMPGALANLKERPHILECLILSTCNRTEVYGVCNNFRACVEQIKVFLEDYTHIPVSGFEDKTYAFDQPESVRQIFRVAGGLDSMVIGEAEVFGQVKRAYEIAHDCGATGIILNSLLQTSFAVAKVIRTNTDIARGAVSVSSVAVELANRIFKDIKNRTVMIIGAGETGESTLKNLVASGAKSVIVSNRSFERAQELAKTLGGEATRLDQCFDHMVRADIVISSTGAPRCIIKKDDMAGVMHRRKSRPIFLIDIAVPRDIEAEVEKIENVYLYNIDDLKAIADTNKREREKEIESCSGYIEKAVSDFQFWLNSLEVTPIITRLNRLVEQIAKKEVDKTLHRLGNVSSEYSQEIEYLGQRIVKQLLHSPIGRLKDFANRGDGYVYLEAVRELFGLDDVKDNDDGKR
jgi:glutamyl-tRNA reductase